MSVLLLILLPTLENNNGNCDNVHENRLNLATPGTHYSISFSVLGLKLLRQICIDRNNYPSQWQLKIYLKKCNTTRLVCYSHRVTLASRSLGRGKLRTASQVTSFLAHGQNALYYRNDEC
jgi:hypothetical protein